MITLITTALTALVTIFPALSNFATSWVSKVYDAKVQMLAAKIGGNVSLAQSILATQVAAEQARVSGLAVIAGSSILTVLVVFFAAPLVFYLWKDVGYDVVVGSLHGCSKGTMDSLKALLEHDELLAKVKACAIYSTDPIRGQAADWATTIIWAIFGSTAAAGGISAAVTIAKKI